MLVFYCANCGHKFSKKDVFCRNCGTEVKEMKKSRESIYEGRIHKCPRCGEVLNSFSSKCLTCGYELRGITGSSVVNDFSIKLDKIDSIERKIELISNFYIPNTKEDIYEFFILAVSQLNSGSYKTINAWEVKLEQAYHKARLIFGDSSEFKYLNDLYNKTLKKKNKKRLKVFLAKGWKYIVGTLMVIGGLFMMILGIVLVSKENNPDSPLNAIFCIGLIIMVSSVFLFLLKNNKS